MRQYVVRSGYKNLKEYELLRIDAYNAISVNIGFVRAIRATNS